MPRGAKRADAAGGGGRAAHEDDGDVVTVAAIRGVDTSPVNLANQMLKASAGKAGACFH